MPQAAPADKLAAMTTSPAAIRLRDLTKTFRGHTGPVPAVRGINLDVAPGEVVALLGPNGAGKTTTLDLVLGFTEPTAGTVQVLGEAPRDAIRAGQVGAVLQSGGLLRDLTIAETVSLVARLTVAPRPVAQVLAEAGLADRASRKVGRCSGGEQQRLRFALALLSNPDLLILDEPTAGMDVTARHDFWQEMHACAAAGRTVVFATHHLEEAEAFAKRIVMLAEGQIVADGPTAEIRARSRARTVCATVTDPAQAVRMVETQFGPGSATVTGSRLKATVGDSDALARLLLDTGATGLEISAPSLEDAFITLTSRAAA